MSDIETLGSRVRGIAEELPLPDTRRAALRLAEAQAGLATALTTSVEPAGVPQLSRAREHVDTALTRLRTASKSLDGYLVSIGVDTASTIKESTSINDSTPAEVAPGSADWWRQRVNTISDGD
ncbi:MAG: hypothetical protein ACRD0P_03025, partial [Stackebrandtia sp.]